jgi:hypothetical protein
MSGHGIAQSAPVGRGWLSVTDLTTRRVTERHDSDLSPLDAAAGSGVANSAQGHRDLDDRPQSQSGRVNVHALNVST